MKTDLLTLTHTRRQDWTQWGEETRKKVHTEPGSWDAQNTQREPVPLRLLAQVILYSGEPLSHHVEMPYLNTCAKSYSILFR